MILHLLTNLGGTPSPVRGLLPQQPSLVKNKGLPPLDRLGPSWANKTK